MKKKPTPTLDELQQLARAHAVNVIQTVKIPVPAGASDDDFAALMNVIVQQLIIAWAAGWERGRA